MRLNPFHWKWTEKTEVRLGASHLRFVPQRLRGGETELGQQHLHLEGSVGPFWLLRAHALHSRIDPTFP
jgi:hypothetical protein